MCDHMKDFINECTEDKYYKASSIEEVIRDFIQSAFNRIDLDLAQLQTDVNSGSYSNQDIFDKIDKIRDKL